MKRETEALDLNDREAKALNDVLIRLNALKKELHEMWFGTRGAQTEKYAAIARLGEAAYWVTEVIKEYCSDDPINERDF